MQTYKISQDVGQACLESYSRILESLAYTVLSRIEDVLAADQATQSPSKPPPANNDSIDFDSGDTMTLLDVMGWGDGEAAPQTATFEESETKLMKCHGSHRPSYLDR